jgi:hypothetical protein
MLGYWGALLFGANEAAELWPQYFAKAPFWAAVVAFLGFAWNSYRDLEDWRLLRSKNLSEKEFDKLDIRQVGYMTGRQAALKH